MGEQSPAESWIFEDVAARKYVDRLHGEALQLAYDTLLEEGYTPSRVGSAFPEQPPLECLEYYYANVVPLISGHDYCTLRSALASTLISCIRAIRESMDSSWRGPGYIEQIMFNSHQIGVLNAELSGGRPKKETYELLQKIMEDRQRGGRNRWANKPKWHDHGLKLAQEIRSKQPNKETAALAELIATECKHVDLPKLSSIEKQIGRWEKGNLLQRRDKKADQAS